jgi:effector-binding domain-containing protein
MEQKIELFEQPELITVAVREKATAEALPEVIGRTYTRLYEHIMRNGAEVTYAPYVAYLNPGRGMTDGVWDMEIGFPVSKPLAGEGGIYAGKVPASTAVTAMHKGSYSTLDETYTPVYRFIAENGYEPAGTHYDFYMNDPDTVAEEELLTKVVIPVKQTNQ